MFQSISYNSPVVPSNRRRNILNGFKIVASSVTIEPIEPKKG